MKKKVKINKCRYSLLKKSSSFPGSCDVFQQEMNDIFGKQFAPQTTQNKVESPLFELTWIVFVGFSEPREL